MKWVISVCHQNMWCGNLTSTLCSVDDCLESGVAYLFNSVSSPKNMTFGVAKTVRNVNRYVYLCSFKFPCKKCWNCEFAYANLPTCTYMTVYIIHVASKSSCLHLCCCPTSFISFHEHVCLVSYVHFFILIRCVTLPVCLANDCFNCSFLFFMFLRWWAIIDDLRTPTNCRICIISM